MEKKSHFSNYLVLFIAAIITVSIVAVGLILLNKSLENPTHKFLLPKEFTGWVEVAYEQSGSPALKEEGRTLLYEVPPSGKVMTSSKNVSGTMVLIYVEQDGRLIESPKDVSMIHGQGTGGGGGGPSRLTFFVGTEEQWQAAKDKRP
ncbi:DUF6843 domain-containing protein [Paenibacillus contaminans]|uniref:DUF6843 domain-containing protein n=1 Tax=Paenibacillus contaminans TaxID=450362 RepID=A0A329M2Y4_9BACL|nr:hypothetical protein [Paenibacillus contaminans]RAV13596.1 hypothetical protein DQG23_32915 [Paenibacillus contaminans]